MPIGGRSSYISALLALAVGATTLATPATALSPAASGSTAAPEVRITDLPARDRARPRGARAVGVTDDFGVVMWRETDPTDREPGPLERVLADGTSSSVLDRHVDAVFGNRLVFPADGYEREVTSRVLPGAGPTTLPVPEGHRLVTYTADGLLLATTGTSVPQQLDLLAWDGGAPTPVTTLDEGSLGWGFVARDEHAVVARLNGSGGAGTALLYVDTAAQQAWPIELTGSCAAATTAPWGLHDGVLAWHGTTAADEHVICTMPAPDPSDPATPAVSTRPAPTMPGVTNQYAGVALLPLGDLVVTSRLERDPYLDSWGADVEAPVYGVGPDGSTTELAGWGHDVIAGPDGQVVLVGGDSPADQAVRQVAADGSSTVLATTTPVRAAYDSIAVDGDRVAFVDDSAVGRALVENELTDSGWATPTGTVVEEGVGTSLAAGEGALAWTSGGGGIPRQWAMRGTDGETRRGTSAGALLEPFLAVSQPWILHRHYSYDELIDTVVDRVTMVDAYSYDADLVDGVLYLPSRAVPNGPEEVVIARDLATGEAETIEVPGCLRSHDVHAAGSWLLVSCETGRRVYDRTGTVAPFAVPDGGSLRLGNGFLVGREYSTNALSWRDLAQGAAGTWQPLGGLASDADGKLQSIAVSRGDVPTVAWFDLREAHMATLPVSTSSVAEKPTGTVVPAAPVVTPEPRDRSLILRWPAPDPAERVTGYWVHRVGSGEPSKLLPASATTYTGTGLTNGTPATFRVTALNIAGRTDAELVTATPVAPPARVTNIQVAVDRLTSEVTMTWDWTATPHSEDLQGFTIWAGQPVVENLAPEVRRATFVLPDAGTGPVEVEAEGVHQSSWAKSAEVTWPGLDTTAPRAGVAGIKAVLLGSATTISLRARDDRKLATRPMDLRWRSAAQGERLGPWRRPASWQGVAKGSRTVKGLAAGATYCFSTRARDHAGNVSRWSPARCTAVAKDDRALSVRTGSWQDLSGRRWFRSTARRTTSAGATLGVGRVRADYLWIVTTTCPTCGRLEVRSGRAVVGRVSLRSAVRRDRRVIRLPWAMRTAGRVTLRAVDGGKPVFVDGIASRSY